MTPDRGRVLGYAYLTAAVVIWSTTEVVTRLVIDSITPIQLSSVRFGVGGTFLLLFLRGQLRRKGVRVNRTIVLHSIWMGVIGVTAANLCFNFSLQTVGAGIVATVYAAAPLMVFLLAAIILKEPLVRTRAIGVIMGFAGIAVLSMSKPSQTFTLLGFLFAVGATGSFALYTVFIKKFAGPYSGLPVTVLCIIPGAAFLIAFAALEGRTDTIPGALENWPYILWLAIGPAGLSYLTFALGLQYVDATQATSMLFLKPPLAAILAAVVLGEGVSWNLAAAMVLILGGLALVLRMAQRKEPVPATETGEEAPLPQRQ